MSQLEKLVAKLSSDSKMIFDEAEHLLKALGFIKKNKGKTSGSRVAFVFKNDINIKILLHKPHPGNELKKYQKDQLFDRLKGEGLI